MWWNCVAFEYFVDFVVVTKFLLEMKYQTVEKHMVDTYECEMMGQNQPNERWKRSSVSVCGGPNNGELIASKSKIYECNVRQ